MNKKWLHTILFIALGVIWFFIGYQLWGPKSTPELQELAIVSEQPPIIKKKKKDPFKFSLLTRDPFLDTYTRPKTARENIPKDRPFAPPTSTKTIWPNIAYYGFVKNNNRSAPLVLLKIDNRLKKLRQGEAFEQLFIKKVYKDSIAVSMGKDTRIFKKSR